MDVGLYQLKYPVRRLLAGLLPWVEHVDPNLVSWAILPVGIITASVYYLADDHPILLLVGALLLLLRMLLATLDGLTAVTFNKSSPRGELANRIPAEFSDALLFVAIAAARPRVGLLAVGICWLITFTGLLGLTINKPTHSVGPAGQTDRLTALLFFSIAGFITKKADLPVDVLKYFLLWICLGGTLTLALRLQRTYKSLEH